MDELLPPPKGPAFLNNIYQCTEMKASAQNEQPKIKLSTQNEQPNIKSLFKTPNNFQIKEIKMERNWKSKEQENMARKYVQYF